MTQSGNSLGFSCNLSRFGQHVAARSAQALGTLGLPRGQRRKEFDMAFEPTTRIITEIGQWGKKNGTKIIKAFYYEGDWCVWAQVELALYFSDFGNVNVTRKQHIGSGTVVADLLLTIEGGKNVAIKLVCETMPSGKKAQGEADVWSRINDAYKALENVSTENINLVAMGIVVSNIANDNTKYNLCGKNLFDHLEMYAQKNGIKVNLYFRWI